MLRGRVSVTPSLSRWVDACELMPVFGSKDIAGRSWPVRPSSQNQSYLQDFINIWENPEVVGTLKLLWFCAKSRWINVVLHIPWIWTVKYTPEPMLIVEFAAIFFSAENPVEKNLDLWIIHLKSTLRRNCLLHYFSKCNCNFILIYHWFLPSVR